VETDPIASERIKHIKGMTQANDYNSQASGVDRISGSQSNRDNSSLIPFEL